VLAAGSMLDIEPTAVAEAATTAGFDACGVRPRDVSPRAADDLRRRCDDAGVVLHDVEVVRLGSDTDADVSRLMEFAVRAGSSELLVVSDLDGFAETEERLGRLCREASGSGVVIALEYMAWVTPSSSRDARLLAESTGCKVVVDALHHYRLGEDPAAIAELRDAGVLAWFQLCDAPAGRPVDLVAEARGARLLPGEGALPLVEQLRAVGSDVAVAVEVQGIESRFADPVERARSLREASETVLRAL